MGGGTLTNSGTIFAGSAGVELSIGKVTNSGFMSGLYQGGSSADNSGTITGVVMSGGSLNNSGLITQNTTDTFVEPGIFMGHGSLNNSGTVTGATALYVQNGNVINSGAIIGQALGVKLGNATLINHGYIAGGVTQVQVEGETATSFSYLNNTGSISGINTGMAFIDGSIVNSGTISGGIVGVKLSGTVTLRNLAAGEISGITISGEDTVLNQGIISQPNSGSNYAMVITSLANGMVTNIGTILGGIEILAGATGATVINSGTVTGGGTGVNMSAGTVINSGHISGETLGVSLEGGSLTNLKVISGAVGAGIYGGSLLNENEILGQSAGVTLHNGLLTNDGKISGTIDGVAMSEGTLINSGSISGKTYGVSIDDATVINSGTIDGRLDAVYGETISLIIDPDAVFKGNVAATGSDNTLELAGSSVGSLSGIGTSFTGFDEISFVTGAAWQLAGNQAGLAAGQQIDGFTLSDAIVLDGFIAQSEKYVAGVGLVLTQKGGGQATLSIASALTAPDFTVSSQGGNTTIALRDTISTTIATTVTLGSIAYPSPLTITNTGAIMPPNHADGIILPDGSSGTIINNGIIATEVDSLAGQKTGIYAADANAVIRNTGDIYGFVGVNLGTGTLTNSGSIGGGYGIVSAAARIINSGTIGGELIGISLTGSTILQNLASGKISGIKISGSQGAASIANSGIIYSANGAEPSQAVDYAIYVVSAPAARISNAGTILGGIKVENLNEPAVQIVNSGEITGSQTGIAAAGATVMNSGTIFATMGRGVSLSAGKVTNSGTISGLLETGGSVNNSGTISAVYISGGSLQNSGQLSGAAFGAYVQGGSLTNSGTVTGTIGLKLLSGVVTNNRGITGQTIGAELTGGTLLNHSEITGSIGAELTAGTFVNDHIILGLSIGLDMTGGTVENAGKISGTTEGAEISGGVLTNTGSITGTTYGVAISDGTLINSGTIYGAEDAVHGAMISLVIDPGAGFRGKVVAQGGGNSLEVAGLGGTLAGIGTKFIGFDEISFASGSEWSLEGNESALTSGQEIDGFTLGDTIVLDNFNAKSDNYVHGVGLVLKGATGPALTLGITGLLKTADFTVSSLGGDTTIALSTAAVPAILARNASKIQTGSPKMAGSTISTTITTTVTLGSAAYPSPLTITDTGKLLPPNFDDGIILLSGSTGTIINHGIIATEVDSDHGQKTGIYAAYADAVIRNTGDIYGFVGVDLGTGSLTNSGSIGGGYGIVSAGARITNSGTVAGGIVGVRITGSTNLQNLAGGEISGIMDTGQGNVSINNHGLIVSAAYNTGYGRPAYAIAVVGGSGTAKITNAGTITGGIKVEAGEPGVQIVNSGEIMGSQTGIVAAGATVTNSGTISATAGQGVSLSTGKVTNSGTIYGLDETGGSVNNSGTISEIYISGGSLQNSGQLSGPNYGAYVQGGSLTNSGTVTGPVGLRLSSGFVTNNRDITGQTIGAELVGGTLLNNQGITASIGAELKAGTLVNDHNILGLSIGLDLIAGTVANGGKISGTTEGAEISGGTLNNTGSIAGTTFGVAISGGTLINSGTIYGGEDAVHGAMISLVIDPGAGFRGKVVAQGSGNSLEVAGLGGTLTGIGTKLIGFNEVSFNSGSEWTLEGNKAGLTTGQEIDGFTLGDTIVLDNFDAISDKYSSGVGLILKGATGPALTLGITGLLKTADFTVSSLGGNTTIALAGTAAASLQMAFLHPVSGSYGVAPTAPSYANAALFADIRSPAYAAGYLPKATRVASAALSATTVSTGGFGLAGSAAAEAMRHDAKILSVPTFGV